MHDADELRDALLEIDLSQINIGDISRKKIERSVRDVIKDLAHDKNIDPDKVTEAELKKMNLSPDEIDEILKLKVILVQVESDKPLDPNL